ncbi:MAG: tRNA 2-thiouridine(34) synthase MnmA [Actinomycetes bacterium]
MRVLAAMSGGVDSSVAAARAVQDGHEVVGVHLALSSQPGQSRNGARGCCTVEDARDARRVADRLDIPFYVWDMAERFRRDVMDDFVAEYAAGRTPNPCVRCNERIKFAALLDKALALGFDAVATGHYARVVPGPDGPQLYRAADHAKDQSYVLAVMGRDALGHALFPLGGVASKAEVRAEADALGLGVAAKPDSHDICFIPDGDTRAWLDARVPRQPGPVVDTAGAVVGQHEGAVGYTVGQRRGLRLGRPAADGRARYVLDVSVVSNTVTVGPAEALDVDVVRGGSAVWLAEVPSAETPLAVQVRAHGAAVPCTVLAADDGAVAVRLDERLSSVATGQTMVLYDGSRVVGSATVSGSERVA